MSNYFRFQYIRLMSAISRWLLGEAFSSFYCWYMSFKLFNVLVLCNTSFNYIIFSRNIVNFLSNNKKKLKFLLHINITICLTGLNKYYRELILTNVCIVHKLANCFLKIQFYFVWLTDRHISYT